MNTQDRVIQVIAENQGLEIEEVKETALKAIRQKVKEIGCCVDGAVGELAIEMIENHDFYMHSSESGLLLGVVFVDSCVNNPKQNMNNFADVYSYKKMIDVFSSSCIEGDVGSSVHEDLIALRCLADKAIAEIEKS